MNKWDRIIRFNWNSDNHWWTRFLFLRGLGFLYFIAFTVVFNQIQPLIGTNGLLPADLFLENVGENLGSKWKGFWEIPSVFWIYYSESFMWILSLVGVVLSLLVISGFANIPIMISLWLLYMSFCHIGQLFYGYGWEFLLLEMGFLGIFFCPLWKGFGFIKNLAPSILVVLALRWVCFRVMFGAGMIKIRGDACWDDWTCLLFHFETQPVPNPLSRFFHHLPDLILKIGVLINHICELIVPWFVFGPKYLRRAAGILIIGFQTILIFSGNLSYLNYLTILACVGCFDDGFYQALFKKIPRVRDIIVSGVNTSFAPTRNVIQWILAVVIIVLSYFPVSNMLSSSQAMNRSWDPLRLVNTYGAFGHVGKIRYEIEIYGTREEQITDQTKWEPYVFKCKPGNEFETPCLMSPYHYRLDWQIWFAAMSTVDREPWFVHFVYKLLKNDPDILSLIEEAPFGNSAPKFIKADRYVYRFYDGIEDKERWWVKERTGVFLPPMSLENSNFMGYLNHFGWIR